jgi:hypothetical protein
MGRGSGDTTCSKVVLIILNAIFLIIGLGVLALGIYLKLDPSYSTSSKLFNVDLADDASEFNRDQSLLIIFFHGFFAH